MHVLWCKVSKTRFNVITKSQYRESCTPSSVCTISDWFSNPQFHMSIRALANHRVNYIVISRASARTCLWVCINVTLSAGRTDVTDRTIGCTVFVLGSFERSIPLLLDVTVLRCHVTLKFCAQVTTLTKNCVYSAILVDVWPNKRIYRKYFDGRYSR